MFAYEGLKRGRESRADREQPLLEALQWGTLSPRGKGLSRGEEGESEAAEGRGTPDACLSCVPTLVGPLARLTPSVAHLPHHSQATCLSISEGFRLLPSSYFLNDQGQSVATLLGNSVLKIWGGNSISRK